MRQEIKKQIVLLAVFTLSVLGSFFLLWWAQGGVVKRRGEVVAMLQKVASIEQNRALMEQGYQEFKVLEVAVTNLKQNFYDSQTIPLFLSDLEATAQEEGVSFEITSARVQTGTGGNGPSVLVEFNSSGSYQALRSFAHTLTNKPYRVVFDRYYLLSAQSASSANGISLKQKTAARSGWQLYGTIRLTTFK